MLPQRSSIPRREDAQIGKQENNQSRESGGQGQQQQQQQEDFAPRIGAQSSERPGGIGISTKSAIPGSRVASKLDPPASPQRREIPTPKAAAPSSLQKTQMPPPARPVRSSSLRQPSSVSSIASVGSKGHLRARSQIVGGTSTAAATTTSQTVKQAEATSPVSTTKPSRPQFTTYQQHFSPKKPAKPQSPIKASAVTAEELDPSLIPSSRPDIAALQTELLQLHLFHASSQQKNAEWKASSEEKLQKMYNSVAGSYRAALAEERNDQRRVNCLALSRWFEKVKKGLKREDCAEQIQMLSHVIQEVADLNDPRGGRYTETVQTFEDWFQKAEQIRRARNSTNGAEEALMTEEEVDFIDPLPRYWKLDIDLLISKLELCLRQLQCLHLLGEEAKGYPENSALVRIAEGHRALVTSMIEELNLMKTIEADVVGSERAWLSHVTDWLQPVDEASRSGPRTGIWKQC